MTRRRGVNSPLVIALRLRTSTASFTLTIGCALLVFGRARRIDTPRRTLHDGTTLINQLRPVMSGSARIQSTQADPAPDRNPRRPTLPVYLTSYVGREQELREIAALLTSGDVRLLTLIGPGGVGKTRLAIEAASRLAHTFPDGVWFVDLAPLIDPALVLPTIARTVGLQESGDDPLDRRLAHYLRDRQALLLLDNFEQIVTAAPGVSALVAACPDLVILATSRQPLAVAGEQEYALQPLAVPTAGDSSLEIPAAVQLFAERARARDPNFVLTRAVTPTVAEICRRLDGLPLAIELAAARIKALPPHDLIIRLERRLPLLTGGRQDAPRRQQTMRDTIAWSYDLLPPDEQALFRRLAIFVGGFTLEAADTIAGESELDTLAGIASLVDKSLLRQTADETERARYGMLETVREYGLEQLEAHGELDAVWLRHAEWLIELAGRLTPLTEPTSVEALARLAAEHDNARAALKRALERGDAETGLRLAIALFRLWLIQSHAREAHRWLEELLALATDETPVDLLAYGQWAFGWFASQQGDIKSAERGAQRALAHADGLADERIRAWAIEGLGIVALMRGDLDQADARFSESHTIAAAIGNQMIMAGTLSNRGAVAVQRGDLAAAARFFDDALPIERRLGDPWMTAMSLGSVSWLARRQGDYRRAAAADRERLAIDRATANRFELAAGCQMAAGAALRLGRPECAARLASVAARVLEELGSFEDPLFMDEAAKILAAGRAALGDEAFGQAWGAGQALPLDDALDEADAIFAAEEAAPDAAAADPAALHGLTPRETQVLRLIARDWSNQQIADELFLSRRTVHKHVENILAKLGTDSRAGAAVWAVRHGVE
jgi:predicted ATPase/DNA-binding CsgD family transcriptional regulator